MRADWEKLHEAQWAFVLDFHAQLGMSQTCLDLQDSLGVGLPALVHAIWLHCAFGVTPGATEVAAFDTALGPWRTQVSEPLRGACWYVKAHPSDLPPQLAGRVAEADG